MTFTFNNNLFILLTIVFYYSFIIYVCYAETTQEFKSLPTTIKAPENDTVLLPCYLETPNYGEWNMKHVKYLNFRFY